MFTNFDDLIAELNTKGIRTHAQIEKYLMDLEAQGLLDPMNLGISENDNEMQALNLVADAMGENDPDIAADLIEEALSIHSECIEAYEFMAYFEELPFFATVWFEKAIRIGDKRFGKLYRRYHKGSLWQYPETRAYLRSLSRYAECQWALGHTKEAIKAYQQLLTLDPDDHLTCRWKMIANMIESYDYVNLTKIVEKYQDDGSAFAKYVIWLSKAIFRFSEAKAYFEEATARNPYVPQCVKNARDGQYVYDDYQPGTIEEARYISSFISNICQKDQSIVKTISKFVKSTQSPKTEAGSGNLKRIK